jgi:2-polyprenyl-6-methoxyphenol hydroxylase-like FAD-dependent oxidoreductase
VTSLGGEPANGSQAVVIGASVAGLLAACALTDRFAQVIVIDRDILPSAPDTRRGVPQSRQAHGLLARGAEALDELLPGFIKEMIAAGGVLGDSQGDFHWYLDGYLMRQATSGLIGVALTRPLIEHLIRARASALPGLRIVDSTDAVGLVTEAGRVTGVRVRRNDDAVESVIAADLVVDAAGRGSRAQVWLEESGYPKPTTSEVRTDVVYVTRHYRREPEHLDGRLGATFVPYPGQSRGAVVLRQEDEQFVVVLAGMLGDNPPSDDAGMLAFAESLSGPDAAEVIRSAKPLDKPARMRYPASQRHHYEKLDRYLDGFIVTGDALCSFNPVYGQGMTVAALEALTLRRLVAGGTENLPRRFFRAASKDIDVPWTLATGGDLRFPEVEGKRPPGDGLVNRYLERYRAAASVDPVLGQTFLRVANLIDPAARLLSPGHMIRVFRSAKKAAR